MKKTVDETGFRYADKGIAWSIYIYADYGFDADKSNLLHQAIASLHQQMRTTLPAGLAEVEEWGILFDSVIPATLPLLLP